MNRSTPRGRTVEGAGTPLPSVRQAAPADTPKDAEVTASGELSRSVGYAVSSALGLFSGRPPVPVSRPQSAVADISFQPVRPAEVGSVRATLDRAGRPESIMQSSREVGSPACPGNDVAEAAATVGTTREPSITSETSPATRAHSRDA